MPKEFRRFKGMFLLGGDKRLPHSKEGMATDSGVGVGHVKGMVTEPRIPKKIDDMLSLEDENEINEHLLTEKATET